MKYGAVLALRAPACPQLPDKGKPLRGRDADPGAHAEEVVLLSLELHLHPAVIVALVSMKELFQ